DTANAVSEKLPELTPDVFLAVASGGGGKAILGQPQMRVEVDERRYDGLPFEIEFLRPLWIFHHALPAHLANLTALNNQQGVLSGWLARAVNQPGAAQHYDFYRCRIS